VTPAFRASSASSAGVVFELEVAFDVGEVLGGVAVLGVVGFESGCFGLVGSTTFEFEAPSGFVSATGLSEDSMTLGGTASSAGRWGRGGVGCSSPIKLAIEGKFQPKVRLRSGWPNQ
jgi:hypothetical protein